MAGTLSLFQRWGQRKPPVGARLDPSHPLTQGLQAYWPLGDGPSVARDLWGIYPLTNASLGGSIPTAPGPHAGPVSVLTGTPNQLYSYGITTPIGGRTQATMAGWLSRTSSTGYATFGWAPNTSNRFFLVWFTDSNVYGVIENGATAGRSVALAGAGWHHFVLVFDGSLAGGERNRLYIDGVRQSTALVAADPPATLASVANLTNYAVGYDFSDNVYQVGAAEDCAVWSRALSASDARTLYTQPYELFAPPVWRRYFIAPSGVTVQSRTCAMAITATVTTTQLAIRGRTVAATGGGLVTVARLALRARTLTITGGGLVTPARLAIRARTVAAVGGGTVTATRLALRARTVTAALGGTVTAGGTSIAAGVKTRTASLAITAQVTSTRLAVRARTVAVTGGGLVATGQLARRARTLVAAAGGTLTAVGQNSSIVPARTVVAAIAATLTTVGTRLVSLRGITQRRGSQAPTESQRGGTSSGGKRWTR